MNHSFPEALNGQYFFKQLTIVFFFSLIKAGETTSHALLMSCFREQFISDRQECIEFSTGLSRQILVNGLNTFVNIRE